MSLLGLPTEIMNLIIVYVTHNYADDRVARDTTVDREPGLFRTHVSALRLTCREFSALLTPAAFSAIRAHRSFGSLLRLQLLSTMPVVQRYAKRLVYRVTELEEDAGFRQTRHEDLFPSGQDGFDDFESAILTVALNNLRNVHHLDIALAFSGQYPPESARSRATDFQAAFHSIYNAIGVLHGVPRSREHMGPTERDHDAQISRLTISWFKGLTDSFTPYPQLPGTPWDLMSRSFAHPSYPIPPPMPGPFPERPHRKPPSLLSHLRAPAFYTFAALACDFFYRNIVEFRINHSFLASIGLTLDSAGAADAFNGACDRKLVLFFESSQAPLQMTKLHRILGREGVQYSLQLAGYQHIEAVYMSNIKLEADDPCWEFENRMLPAVRRLVFYGLDVEPAYDAGTDTLVEADVWARKMREAVFELGHGTEKEKRKDVCRGRNVVLHLEDMVDTSAREQRKLMAIFQGDTD